MTGIGKPSKELALAKLLLICLIFSPPIACPIFECFQSSCPLISEIPPSLRRSKSVVIARFTYACLNIFSKIIAPYQVNPSA